MLADPTFVSNEHVVIIDITFYPNVVADGVDHPSSTERLSEGTLNVSPLLNVPTLFPLFGTMVPRIFEIAFHGLPASVIIGWGDAARLQEHNTPLKRSMAIESLLTSVTYSRIVHLVLARRSLVYTALSIRQ